MANPTTCRGLVMIYIMTNEVGKGIKLITAFEDRADFAQYADDVTACTDINILRADNITDICHKLMDAGMGFGMRQHSRISRKEAKRHVSQGVKSCGM